ncbi:MAG: hypothetical protein HYV61_07415 [Candidatus Rokubacteria bacterium]|nr:hypothetical protein [Candidatus Rokubacteria bacterium]
MARRLLLGGLALALLGCASAPSQPSKDEVIRRILRQTVQVVTERGGVRLRSSSGVVINAETDPPRSFVLTTAHSLEGLEGAELYVVPGGRRGPRLKAVLLATAREADLALVRLDGLALPARAKGGRSRWGRR